MLRWAASLTEVRLMTPWVRSILALGFGLGVCAHAQTTSPAQNPQSTFRAGIDIARIDVSVLDKDRHPIRGLTAADFTVLADGKPQKVMALSEIDVPDPIPPAAPWLRDVTPDVTTNQFRDRRVWLIVMDDATVQLDLWVINHAKSIARDIVAKMGAGDIAAVVFTLDNRSSQDFTADRSKLMAAIDRFTSAGGSSVSDAGIQERGGMPLYPMYSAKTLKQSVTLLSGVQDRRKVLVYISGGIGVDIEDLMPKALGSSLSSQQDALQLSGSIGETLRAAKAGNVNVYAYDPEGLPTQPRAAAAQIGQDFLRSLASITGGRAAVNTNDAGPAITQMFVENASYYLLGYQTPPTQGRMPADVVVTVNRPGAIVRARRQIDAVNAGADRKAPAPPENQALNGLLPVSNLPLAVSAAAFRKSRKGSDASVAITLGVLEAAGKSGRESVDLITTAFDQDGNAKNTARTKGEVVFRSGVPSGDLVMYEVLSRIDLKPGRYQLRLAAHRGGTDESGSVFADVDVPDFSKDAVSLSGVVLSSTPAPVAAPKNTFTSLIPVVPTTLRDFSAATHVDAFVRIYQGGRGDADPVTVSVKFIDGKNVAVLGRREPIPAINFLSDGSAEYRLSVPVSTLEPGPYLMRIEATRKDHTARRDVMFFVRR